jgi:hypothetical protein
VVSFCREARYVGWALNTSVLVDRLEIADLDNGTLVHVAVDPGRHEFFSDEERDAIYLETEAGKQYFFRIVLEAGVWKGHGRLVQMPGERGRLECSKLKRGKDIRQPELVVDTPR